MLYKKSKFIGLSEADVKDYWDKFDIGEEIYIKRHVYKVIQVEEKRLVLEPIRPRRLFGADNVVYDFERQG